MRLENVGKDGQYEARWDPETRSVQVGAERAGKANSKAEAQETAQRYASGGWSIKPDDPNDD